MFVVGSVHQLIDLMVRGRPGQNYLIAMHERNPSHFHKVLVESRLDHEKHLQTLKTPNRYGVAPLQRSIGRRHARAWRAHAIDSQPTRTRLDSRLKRF
jgi:hypothetical protein